MSLSERYAANNAKKTGTTGGLSPDNGTGSLQLNDLQRELKASGERVTVYSEQASAVLSKIFSIEFPGSMRKASGSMPLVIRGDGVIYRSSDRNTIARAVGKYGITLKDGQCFAYPQGFDAIFALEVTVPQSYVDKEVKNAVDPGEGMY